MTHASVPEEMRRQLGITDGLIRFSVGLEDVRDLIDDIETALQYAFSNTNDKWKFCCFLFKNSFSVFILVNTSSE